MHENRRRVERQLPADTLIVSCSRPFLAASRIHDISIQGLSVEYEEGSERALPDRPITITLAGGSSPLVTVDDLRCQPVYDIAILAHDQGFRGRRMRQSGMTFCPDQVEKISKLSRLLDTLG